MQKMEADGQQTLDRSETDSKLKAALEKLAADAVAAVKGGAKIIVLSDRMKVGEKSVPVLLATAAVNRSLVEAGLRSSVGLIVESGEVREVHHFAVLLGYGATAVNPYLSLAAVSSLFPENKVAAAANYVQAVDKGLKKIMSKMGISTLRSYRSAQIFEAVGLSKEVVDLYFPGTPSRVGGLGFHEIENSLCASRHSPRSACSLPHGSRTPSRGGYAPLR